MKLHKLLAVAALLAVPVWVLAQAVGNDGSRLQPRVGTNPPAAQVQGTVIGGILRADTTFKAMTMSTSGGISMYDESRDRNAYRTGTLINNQLGASGTAMADSSNPTPSYDLRRIGLMFYPQHDSASTVVRLAVQIRAHASSASDSASAFPWLRWPYISSTAASFRSDSIGHFPTVGDPNVPATAVQATSANSSGGGILPGEFLVVFNISRNDTLGTGVGKPWSYPKGIYVPLTGSQGEWFWAPYFSVRVRVLNGVAARFRLRVDYVGTPL